MSIRSKRSTADTASKRKNRSLDFIDPSSLPPKRLDQTDSPTSRETFQTKPGILHWIESQAPPSEQLSSPNPQSDLIPPKLDPDAPFHTEDPGRSSSPMTTNESSDGSRSNGGPFKGAINASHKEFPFACDLRQTFFSLREAPSKPRKLEEFKAALDAP